MSNDNKNAAALPLDVELAQDRLTELRKLERDVLDSLPAVYYMDPPDGGNVSLGEQVKRMAEDAALWRKHSNTPAAPGIDLSKLQRYRVASDTNDVRNLYKDDTGTWVKIQDVERALIDASPKGGSTDENNDLLPELRDVEDYFTSVDPNPIHLATVRQAINVIVGSLKGGSDAKDADVYEYRQHYFSNAARCFTWTDWHSITREQYEDRLKHPRPDCEVRIRKAAMQATSAEVGA